MNAGQPFLLLLLADRTHFLFWPDKCVKMLCKTIHCFYPDVRVNTQLVNNFGLCLGNIPFFINAIDAINDLIMAKQPVN